MEKYQITHEVAINNIGPTKTIRFITKEFYFDVQMQKDGKLEVRCSDGLLAIHPKSSNQIELRCEPWWPDQDVARIAKHLIDTYAPEEAAERIVDAIRGRPFRKDS
jgi:hypothetical protein